MTTKEAKTEQTAAVYIPFKTLQTSLEVLSQGIPQRLDRTAWPSFSGIVRSQTLSGYKFLGLVIRVGGISAESTQCYP